MSFLVKAINDTVNFTTMNTPADEDNPNLMLKAKQAFDTMKGDLGLICGDFKTTIDAKYDR